ncbi:conserved hypothetical protein [Ricinus communis]|uniref:Uncharacterized protein n=1 Tax=Ricinus communis TaxID=3988 RepID=B9RGX7_RICCO|nr:conserved hypothetical protein [Ricinus communis]
MDPELYNAAISGDIAFVDTKICDEDSVFLSHTTPKKNTLLHIAAEFEQTQFIKKQNSKGDTPLHIAARVGCLELVDFLIEQASSVDIESRRKKVCKDLVGKVNGDMDTALHCMCSHYEVVKFLIAA